MESVRLSVSEAGSARPDPVGPEAWRNGFSLAAGSRHCRCCRLSGVSSFPDRWRVFLRHRPVCCVCCVVEVHENTGLCNFWKVQVVVGMTERKLCAASPYIGRARWLDVGIWRIFCGLGATGHKSGPAGNDTNGQSGAVWCLVAGRRRQAKLGTPDLSFPPLRPTFRE